MNLFRFFSRSQSAPAARERLQVLLAHERAATGDESRPRWPMIVLRTPKGWTCPPEIDGKRTEDSWRAHQVPLASARDTPEHLETLEQWLRSYRADEWPRWFTTAGTTPPPFKGPIFDNSALMVSAAMAMFHSMV